MESNGNVDLKKNTPTANVLFLLKCLSRKVKGFKSNCEARNRISKREVSMWKQFLPTVFHDRRSWRWCNHVPFAHNSSQKRPLCGQATLSQALVPAATWIFTDEIPSACWWPRGKGVNQLGGRCGSCWYNKEERDAALRPAGNEERGEGWIEHVELRTNVFLDRFCRIVSSPLFLTSHK